MRTKLIVGLGVVAFLFFLGDSTFAQEPSAKRFAVGGRLSYYEVDDVNLGTGPYEPEAGGLAEGNFTLFLHRLVSFEFSGGYTIANVNASVGGYTGDFGEFTQIPILATVRIHLWHPDISRPSGFYFGGGLGYYINDHEISNAFKSALPGLSIEMDNSLGAHVNAGFEINLVGSLALNLDLKYIFMNEADVKMSGPTVGTTTSEVDLNGLLFGVGLKYYF